MGLKVLPVLGLSMVPAIGLFLRLHKQCKLGDWKTVGLRPLARMGTYLLLSGELLLQLEGFGVEIAKVLKVTL